MPAAPARTMPRTRRLAICPPPALKETLRGPGARASAEAVETPIGLLPAPGALDLDGLEIGEADLDLLLTVDRQAWKLEANQIPEFFRGFGEHLPARLAELHQELIDRLG